MPAVWELRCPKRIRSRRALFQEGLKALRRDAGVRRVACSKTSALLCARVTFWNDGPVDDALDHLREEFGPANVNRPAPSPRTTTTWSAYEARLVEETRLSMGAMVSAAERLRPAVEAVGRNIVALNDATREMILRNALGSEEGHRHLAASLAGELRRRMDYTSLSRRIFAVEPLPPAPPGAIYMASEPEFVGRMTERPEVPVGAPAPFEIVERGPPQPLPMPSGQIFFMDWAYGAGSRMPDLPSPVPVPSWCVPGTWLYDQKTGRFAIVRTLLPGNRAGVKYWFQGRLRRRVQPITGRDLEHHWNPCDGPKLPRESWWEDLLRDDFADL